MNKNKEKTTNDSLVKKWLPVIDSPIGKPITNKYIKILMANYLEAQFRYNKFVYKVDELKGYQNYAMPLVRRILSNIDHNDIHYRYLDNIDSICNNFTYDIEGHGVIVKSTVPNCVNGVDIESLMMECVELDITPHVHRALSKGKLGLCPIISVTDFNIHFDGRNITNRLSIR